MIAVEFPGWLVSMQTFFNTRKIYGLSYYYCSGRVSFMLLLRTLMNFFQFGDRKLSA